MEQPQIRYTKTSDGVSIAYYAIGAGPACVYLPPTPATHVELEWNVPEMREAVEQAAKVARLVRYDARGFGLSTREGISFSLEAAERDLDAVVNALALESCTLMATGADAMTAISYAAHRPELVDALVLNIPVADGKDAFGTRYDTSLALARTDWPAFLELFASTSGRGTWLAGDAFMEFAAGAMSQQTTIQYLEALRDFSAVELLARVAAPTLVLGRRQLSFLPPEHFGRIAAAIPNASHRTLEGSSVSLGEEDVAAAILAFFGAISGARRPRPAPSQGEAPAGAFRAVLFTDLVGHTEMMRRLGDTRGREVLREHEKITRAAIREHGGSELKTDGDSFMVSFSSLSAAVSCAIGLQRAMARRNETAAEPLHVRMGLNAGEPIDDGGDLFGESVILAARIAAHANAAELLVPESVRQLLAGKAFTFADRGEFVPKGFDDAVRLYEVRWRE